MPRLGPGIRCLWRTTARFSSTTSNPVTTTTTTAAPRRHIELRSDTLTKPCEGMRRAMYQAEVGDDCYDEDRTVVRLEEALAGLTGKEAALYCASGTLSNLLAIATTCRRGDEIILGDANHIYTYEGGGASSLLSVAFHPIPTLPNGTNRYADIVDAIRDDTMYFARSRMVAVENTHNKADGRPLPVSFMDEVGKICHQNGLAFHVDGARIMNASVALQVPVAELVRAADSVSICMSKGLGAPIGSILCGSKAFIKESKRQRKTLGGGWRQAGITAAAALYALENNVHKLKLDHDNARALAHGLSRIPGISCDPDAYQTSIVYFTVTGMPPAKLVARLRQHGIWLGQYGKGNRLRAVTNLMVTRPDINYVVEKVAEIMEEEMATDARYGHYDAPALAMATMR